jgi:hypothetical protein
MALTGGRASKIEQCDPSKPVQSCTVQSVPELLDPFFDGPENGKQDGEWIRLRQREIDGRHAVGRFVGMTSSVVRVRMAIPPTLPCPAFMLFDVMKPEITVFEPPDLDTGVFDRRWIADP